MGGTLLIPSGPGNTKHLHIILTDKCDDGQHLLVGLSSIKPGRPYDDACEVEVGDHRFVSKRSYVEYRLTKRDRASHLSKCVKGWTFTPHDDVTDALLNRICDGLLISKFISQGMRRYYQDQCGF